MRIRHPMLGEFDIDSGFAIKATEKPIPLTWKLVLVTRECEKFGPGIPRGMKRISESYEWQVSTFAWMWPPLGIPIAIYSWFVGLFTKPRRCKIVTSGGEEGVITSQVSDSEVRVRWGGKSAAKSAAGFLATINEEEWRYITGNGPKTSVTSLAMSPTEGVTTGSVEIRFDQEEEEETK